MIFAQTSIAGVVLVTPDRFVDERGFLARTWDQAEFEAQGLNARVVQRNVSGNRQVGTLRGMHYQRAPHAQAKLVVCFTGSIYDVVVDLRRESTSYRQWFGVELSAETGAMLFVPEGCGHGFETLEADSTVEYLMSEPYAPGFEAGVRWDDPAFGIRWPMPPAVISERDRGWPNFDSA